MPLRQLLTKIKIPPETEAALLGNRNKLRDILDLIIAYDRGNWEKTHELCHKLHLEQEMLADDYIHALQWVDLTLGIGAEDSGSADAPPLAAQAITGNGLRPM
jgi:c-di-GMP-related signal transduction protein